MHEVSLGEVEALACINGLDVVRVHEAGDQMGRAEVRWTLMALRLPDDGAGAFPLIRGIILADEKNSTYKRALLRVSTPFSIRWQRPGRFSVVIQSNGDDSSVIEHCGDTQLTCGDGTLSAESSQGYAEDA